MPSISMPQLKRHAATMRRSLARLTQWMDGALTERLVCCGRDARFYEREEEEVKDAEDTEKNECVNDTTDNDSDNQSQEEQEARVDDDEDDNNTKLAVRSIASEGVKQTSERDTGDAATGHHDVTVARAVTQDDSDAPTTVAAVTIQRLVRSFLTAKRMRVVAAEPQRAFVSHIRPPQISVPVFFGPRLAPHMRRMPLAQAAAAEAQPKEDPDRFLGGAKSQYPLQAAAVKPKVDCYCTTPCGSSTSASSIDWEERNARLQDENDALRIRYELTAIRVYDYEHEEKYNHNHIHSHSQSPTRRKMNPPSRSRAGSETTRE